MGDLSNPSKIDLLSDVFGSFLFRTTSVFVISAVASTFSVLVIVSASRNYPIFAAVLACHAFVILTFLLVGTYVFLAGAKIPQITEPRKLANLIAYVVMFSAAHHIMWGPIIVDKFAKRSFLNEPKYQVLFYFFSSIIMFTAMIYAIGTDDYLTSQFFVTGIKIDGFAATLFTLDLVASGLILDVFEHFGLSISDLKQSKNTFGMVISFILRTSAGVFAIAVFLQLLDDTNKRLGSSSVVENQTDEDREKK